jgi:hypothetical protein
MLELNARPGISIQIANRAGLRHRLDRVEAWLGSRARAPEVDDCVRFARRNFASA